MYDRSDAFRGVGYAHSKDLKFFARDFTLPGSRRLQLNRLRDSINGKKDLANCLSLISARKSDEIFGIAVIFYFPFLRRSPVKFPNLPIRYGGELDEAI